MKQRQMTTGLAMYPDLDLDVMTTMPICRYLQDQGLEPHTVVSTDHTLVLFAQGARVSIRHE